ncbi:polyphosphoinositide phosphatase isoform X3 [Daktulosphaira vitifoliae]|uniref:polyphosphoinositide phosphatase isoform X3 n=1 Tax=Daktulosphaira vitifoliae TaxID=58002 RepID=UPI0021A9B1CA|nr:polyphosphoinositide phosphatase isoform X3 [Daktulosphaira vitifoliae]
MKELNDNRQANIKFISARNLVQKIGVYESKNRYFVVGSNNARTKFRVLKIDRTEGHDLTIVDDQVEYSEHDMISVLSLGVHRNTGLNKIASAFGIVGFVKLLEGYYMILITKRRRVAVIGQEIIYKIEDTSMIYIPNDAYRIPNINEPRYLKIFQSVDLSSNFYFSYSYDVTQTLQVNLAVAQNIPKNSNGDLLYITRSNSNKIFVWNDYLLKNVRDKLHPDWVLNIMHGFISQSNVSIFGRPIYITLIARRSNRYAGTRFLKRGANNKGEVGNEVETEQIVQDVGVSCQNHLYISSFLQMRGSVPGLWSQDMTKMLYYLGLLETPSLEYDTDCVRLLEVSYEDHGDTLALQYGGSQLIHRIKTYRKTAPWTSQGNDIMQTLSRYYSNTFSDTEKQNAINLFLGLFIPNENQPHIWEQNYDYYLHHPETISYSSNSCVPLTQWWDDDVLDCLPLSYAEHKKQYNHICPSNALKADDFDSFAYFYRTDEFSVMSESYTFEISHSVRDFMPNCVTDFSPFSIRIRPGKKREQISDKTKNPSMTGSSSTNSINSSSSCGTSESDDDTNYSKRTESLNIVSKDNSITFDIQAEQIISYGINLCTIKPNDIATYKKYVLMASDPSTIISVTQSVQPRYDSSFSVSLSDVSSSNMYLYESYVRNGLQGAHQCNDNAILEYKKYIVNI